ncbi:MULTISPECIES: hypothetical protein [Burkholderia]|uniref:hypothetical protein n=1 Tax=Burkholderia TaxID=32008 RepID=UPI00075327EC|nr:MULTISPECIES: hypothetical protein [Burkholderia]AOJ69328.1 hypothetical protein WS78_11610 [Burkholderia savannae]KVG37446.1 hypothetical protein WS77_01840 [Burkholderia sp. MSMB0265]KVG88289.1 hypothetical protein WS81_25385 [Burkholderia sp. MSMB2040]KVG93841.1 hypothetical protein WS82_08880 [Burkholderia sp. MSMB2041]KVH01092.1 hypothetical protein WS83_20440 [Burkholderia sp. MSMB2042]
MSGIYGLPQPLTGNELVTIKQMQNGNWAECTMPLAALIQLMSAFAASLPTDKPSTAGQLWNDAGVVAIS